MGENSTALAEISAARQALARAQDIYTILEIRDVAKAAATLAEAQNAGDAANEAKEVQLRAERKAGTFLKTLERSKGGDARSFQAETSASDYAATMEDAGISRPTAHRWQKIADVPDEEFERFVAETKDEGKELTQASALRLAGRLHEPEPVETPPLPHGKYRTIVIDPPWPIRKIERNERPRQGAYLDYPTMTIEEIESLPIGELALEDGCHLYLWVTQKYLPYGLNCLRLWGFRYQCLMTWVKPTGITPFSWMYNTEHVLFARAGSLKLQRMGIKLSFEAPVIRGTHSTKPDAFFNAVREASPEPRLEMFARRQRDGFDVWGNEAHDG